MYTLDVKNAFLVVDQPPEENAFVVHAGKTYKLGKVLPGQRTAASRLFSEFKPRAQQDGLHGDKMQPSVFKNGNGRVVPTIHLMRADSRVPDFWGKCVGPSGWVTSGWNHVRWSSSSDEQQ